MNFLKTILLPFIKIYLSKKFDVRFRKNSKINLNNKYEGRNVISVNATFIDSSIGYGSYVGKEGLFSKTKIGRFTSIAPRVKCVFGKHPTHTFVSTHPAFFSARKQLGFSYTDKQLFEEFEAPKDGSYSIVIGNDVWVGTGVTILDGVSIGDGAIVASNSLVTKDVEPYSIVGGVPAKPIKKRFEPEQIEFLLDFKWWDRDIKWIESNAPLFANIENFMNQFGPNEK